MCIDCDPISFLIYERLKSTPHLNTMYLVQDHYFSHNNEALMRQCANSTMTHSACIKCALSGPVKSFSKHSGGVCLTKSV